MLREDWEALVRMAISPLADETQRREMRMAFYAGAWAALQTLRGHAEKDPAIATIAALDLEKECLAALAEFMPGGRFAGD